MEYVRLMAQFQYSGGFGAMPPPLYDLPTYPHHPGFGAEANQKTDYPAATQAMPTPTLTQLEFPVAMNLPLMNGTSIPHSGPWQNTSLATTGMPEPQYLASGEYTLVNPVEDQTPQKGEDVAVSPEKDNASDGFREEGTPTLSPSSYFWNEMTLPGCSDATGTCQCGDGCACVGCITHGGHNGVHVENTVHSEHERLPDFTADSVGLGLDDISTDFVEFHAAPT